MNGIIGKRRTSCLYANFDIEQLTNHLVVAAYQIKRRSIPKDSTLIVAPKNQGSGLIQRHRAVMEAE